MTRPRTKKGEQKIIGVWDIEKGYSRFKAVGAKRYIYEYDDGVLQMTCAGVRKSEAVPFLLWNYAGGKLERNEFLSAQFLAAHEVIRDEYYTPFQQLARIAYSRDSLAKEALNYLVSQLTLNYAPVFDIFGEGMYIPAKFSGKQTVDYIDYGFSTICVDYLKIPALITEQSAVYMEPQNYKMSITDEYRELLRGRVNVSD